MSLEAMLDLGLIHPDSCWFPKYASRSIASRNGCAKTAVNMFPVHNSVLNAGCSSSPPDSGSGCSCPARAVVPSCPAPLPFPATPENNEESKILRIIKRLQTNRNAACYQSVLAFVKREDKDDTKENVTLTINRVNRKIIDINKDYEEKKQSSKISKEAELTEEINMDMEEEENLQDDDERSESSHETSVIDRLHAMTNNKIKTEVKNAIKSGVNYIKSIVTESNNQSYIKENLITPLKEEISNANNILIAQLK